MSHSGDRKGVQVPTPLSKGGLELEKGDPKPQDQIDMCMSRQLDVCKRVGLLLVVVTGKTVAVKNTRMQPLVPRQPRDQGKSLSTCFENSGRTELRSNTIMASLWTCQELRPDKGPPGLNHILPEKPGPGLRSTRCNYAWVKAPQRQCRGEKKLPVAYSALDFGVRVVWDAAMPNLRLGLVDSSHASLRSGCLASSASDSPACSMHIAFRVGKLQLTCRATRV
ncbi:hypothetical protein LIA77_07303 [Sarocladium implicatum]|nr:hypothetical protein LIA77_07303 [Sarocladium implicatum]